ncbi:hypothetical protein GCM10012284_52470 [Mangrovihabitans endophyticus]|uniref:Uncharacterized protein n=1 Tax=Mangrovihabitans endophyticus TaxID=1751298 RepID=A0A8J3C3V7_9ACTN|nr:hypothetical protein GCM10012284_52470 [Mangrovihabitans endophyticus]
MAADTAAGLFSTLDTVPRETPADAATSFTEGVRPWGGAGARPGAGSFGSALRATGLLASSVLYGDPI